MPFHMINPIKVMATTGSLGLAEEVCAELAKKLPAALLPENPAGLLSRPKADRFSNQNMEVQVDNVRGHFIVIVHTQTPPVSDQLIELIALLDAVRNASPEEILLVFPYMPYSRSDRKNKVRISTMGQCLPHIISGVLGVRKVLLIEPHSQHLKHYFSPTADEIPTTFLMLHWLEKSFFSEHRKEDAVVVFADAGAVQRFKKVPELLGLKSAYVDKSRTDNSETPRVTNVVGDIAGKTCLLLDDEILTGNTAIGDAEALKKLGAADIVMLATHAILESNKDGGYQAVIKKLEDSPITRFIVTDTIPVAKKLAECNAKKFTILPSAGFIAEAISRAVQNQSLSSLYDLKAVPSYFLPPR